jgi:hypothetical protein
MIDFASAESEFHPLRQRLHLFVKLAGEIDDSKFTDGDG